MPAKDPRLYLIHIRDCCGRILDYTAGLGSEWPETQIVLDAVCRNLGIIGEAAAQLGATFHQAHSEVPWRSIIDTRNVLIHAYDRVNQVVLCDIVERDIPQLLAAARRLLEEAS